MNLGVALGLVALLAGGASAADPRLERASGLLGERAGWPEAIDLYRQVLAEAPESPEATIGLARVLAWSERYDEALGLYARVVQERPRDLELRLERGEVLSWAGRYGEARADLEAVLAREPRNARAARALARVERWSGHDPAADRAYRRALALEDDSEAYQEWRALRSRYRPEVRATAYWSRDSDRFERVESGLVASWYPELATHLRLYSGWIRAGHPRSQAQASSRADQDRDRARTLALSLERRLDARWTLEAGAGVRDWLHAAARGYGHLGVRLAPAPSLQLGLRLEQGDLLDLSDSFEALESGLQQTALAATLWKGLPSRLEIWSRFEVNRLSDGNRRQALDASLTWRPRDGDGLEISLAANGVRFAERSTFYYDPRLDLGAQLRADGTIHLGQSLELQLGAGAGGARSRTELGSELGTLITARARVEWHRGPWRAGIEVETFRSQRNNPYRSSLGRLSLERSF
ncbi:MAG: tetratricopeptide repeat protein [Myxococcota bacterium]